MNVYVIQTRFGCESDVCSQLRRMGYDAFVPSKQMQLRCGGEWTERITPIFTQYLFIRFSSEPDAKDYYAIRSVEGAIKFLGVGKPTPISRTEEAYIQWLWNEGKPLEASKVYISPQGAKLLLSGPLRRYDGEIEYQLRQRRASIQISIGGRKRKLTLPVVSI